MQVRLFVHDAEAAGLRAGDGHDLAGDHAQHVVEVQGGTESADHLQHHGRPVLHLLQLAAEIPRI
jgi:hypothetical protein